MRVGRVPIRLASLRSRVARRVFALFVACALVPVGVFAVFAFRSVSAQLEDAARNQLREASKAAGMALVERLSLLETTLAAVQDDLGRAGARGVQEMLAGRFRSVWVLSEAERAPLLQVRAESGREAETAAGGASAPPFSSLLPRKDSERRHLAAGRALLRVQVGADGGPARLFLVRAHGGDRVAVGEVEPGYLWRPENLRSHVVLAVFDSEGRRIFSSSPDAPAPAPSVGPADGQGGRQDWERDGQRFLGESWELFLRSLFQAPSWRLVHYQSAADVFAPMRDFQGLFALVTALSLWVVMLLSLTQIRRSLVPIAVLRDATRRISEGDYDVAVSIDTRDEFRDLGRSFNEMAHSIADLRHHLEDKVRERTRELARALDELRKAQAQLVHREKMASIGQFVAGIAHEINNPLSFIGGNLHFLAKYSRELRDALVATEREAVKRIPELQERIDAIHEEYDLDYALEDMGSVLDGCADGIQRTTSLVKDLRTFSRLDQGDCNEVDLNDALDSTLNLLRGRLAHLEVERDYQALPTVECLGSQVNQVILNLIANAADASEPGSRLTLRTRRLAPEEAPDAAEWVAFEVEDEGCGMDEQTASRIFDPFFTTKDVGQGTGLGLAISYGVVERHGGRIDLRTAPGEGTCFRVVLPVAYRPSPEPDPDEGVGAAGSV
jgi:signal transduction histidine kinase